MKEEITLEKAINVVATHLQNNEVFKEKLISRVYAAFKDAWPTSEFQVIVDTSRELVNSIKPKPYLVFPNALKKGHYTFFDEENNVVGTMPSIPGSTHAERLLVSRDRLDLEDAHYYVKHDQPYAHLMECEYLIWWDFDMEEKKVLKTGQVYEDGEV